MVITYLNLKLPYFCLSIFYMYKTTVIKRALEGCVWYGYYMIKFQIAIFWSIFLSFTVLINLPLHDHWDLESNWSD